MLYVHLSSTLYLKLSYSLGKILSKFQIEISKGSDMEVFQIFWRKMMTPLTGLVITTMFVEQPKLHKIC